MFDLVIVVYLITHDSVVRVLQGEGGEQVRAEKANGHSSMLDFKIHFYIRRHGMRGQA